MPGHSSERRVREKVVAEQSQKPEWKPSIVKEVLEALATSSQPVRVETDAGGAYIKALGNPEGPHSLVCEWVGTRLAGWLGLPTLEMSRIDLRPQPQIRFANGSYAIPGPAIATKFVEGDVWSGLEEDLKVIVNPEAIAGLVVFDTWTRNNDRFCRPPGGAVRENLRNVFLSEEGVPEGRFKLLAIDHTACFRCEEGEISAKVANIGRVRDPRIFGLFDGFTGYCTKEAIEQFLGRLAKLKEDCVKKVIAEVPREWQLSEDRRRDLTNFICGRAYYLVEKLVELLTPQCGWNAKSGIK